MKNKNILLLASLVGLNITGLMASGSEKAKPQNTTACASKSEAYGLIARVKAIYAMDRSKMTKDQKHELRTEVLSIREKLNDPTYIYISGGALIIIIILLIILLL